MTYTPTYPHDDIAEIAPNVYMARGTLLETGAHAAVTAAVARAYKK